MSNSSNIYNWIVQKINDNQKTVIWQSTVGPELENIEGGEGDKNMGEKLPEDIPYQPLIPDKNISWCTFFFKQALHFFGPNLTLTDKEGSKMLSGLSVQSFRKDCIVQFSSFSEIRISKSANLSLVLL